MESSIDELSTTNGGRRVGLVNTLTAGLTNWRNWWVYAVVALVLLMLLAIAFDPLYGDAFQFIWPGVGMTMFVTLGSFATALVIGLIMGLARVSSNRLFYNIATFYVETIRGVPILVQILYVAYVLTPALVDLLNSAGAQTEIRDFNMYARAMLGLAIAYGAFEAEVFRAGIQSIERGQMEAARSLGMSYMQAMRYVILPQAIRRILPPIGNDFVAMLKDTSLASILAVREVTHMSNLYRSSNFRTFEPLNIATLFYLTLSLILTRVVRYLERRLDPDD